MAPSIKCGLSAALINRAQSTSTPSQTVVEATNKQSTEVSTIVPPKEAVTADIISGAPSEP